MYKFRYYRMDQEEKRKVIEKLREVLQAEGIRLAILFGSFIEAESFRDIDIAIYLEDPQDLDRVLEIGMRLEEKLDIPIDVAPLQFLSPRFRLKVLTKGLPIIEESGLYEAMLIQTLDELIIMSEDK
ncbi:DNA polymerase beta domain protein region [Ignisphaera aggregans DSM 17230]|uniref:DNA polymerase beta domain protein region n=1 Tax=Ignisphaera aggregans (strain DSM 17230 / JCM 13409 / AQ1.S1) TaxID=583356 RepID=E0SSZ4_IGNAA|nr:DNA polymerase beta domain protein region [Ignisphaera aggregans DSM 17230]